MATTFTIGDPEPQSSKSELTLTFSDLVDLVRAKFDNEREQLGYARAAKIVDKAIEPQFLELALNCLPDKEKKTLIDGQVMPTIGSKAIDAELVPGIRNAGWNAAIDTIEANIRARFK